MRRLLLVLGLASLAAGLLESAAPAATFVVNRVDDQVALAPTSDGVCDADDGDPGVVTCTLRAAVQESNGTTGVDTIQLPDLGREYALTLPGVEDSASGGDLDVRRTVSIQGSGEATILGSGLDRVVHAGPDATAPGVTISNVRVRGGGGVSTGGGILVETGTVSLDGVTVADNLADSGASVAGAGLWIRPGGSHTITYSTLSGNEASGETTARGGGLWVGSGALVNLTNSTISGNGAIAGAGGDGEGGGVWSEGSVGLTHVTVAGNTAAGLNGKGGSVFSAAGGSIGFRATILADGGGDPGAQNCESGGGLLSTFGFNLEGQPGGVGVECGLLSAANDRYATSALLAPLADRGGRTETHALLNGSMALDAVPSCSPLTVDQRSQPRPGAFACDIGSFERQVLPEPGSNCLGRAPTIIGFAEGEKIVGTPGDDVIVAAGGNDKVKGGDGNDRICSGKGKDTSRGGPGKDRIDGEDGDDQLYGQGGNDRLDGASGKDLLVGGQGRDLLDGGGQKKDNCRGGRRDKVRDCDD